MTWAAQAGSVIGGAGLALLTSRRGGGLRIAGLAAWALGLAGLAAYLAPSMVPRSSSPPGWRPRRRCGRRLGAAARGRTCSRSRRLPACRCASRSSSATRTPTCCCRSTSSSGARARARLGARRPAGRPRARARSGCAPARRLRRLDRPHPPLECGRARGSDLRRRVRVAVRPALARLRAAAVARPLADVAVGRPRRHGARYASIGLYQWATRDVFWNPKVIVGNAYAPFFRVNSIFWDPSIYGRYLTVGILTALAGILLGGVRGAAGRSLRGRRRHVDRALLLLLPVELRGARCRVLGQALVDWGRRAALAFGVLAPCSRSAPLGSAAGASQNRDEVSIGPGLGHERPLGPRGPGPADRASPPADGVGAGGFRRAYADRVGLPGKRPKKAASHTDPCHGCRGGGPPGPRPLGWLVAAALFAAFRGLGRGFTSRVSFAVGLTLSAVTVHSFFYNALFDTP